MDVPLTKLADLYSKRLSSKPLLSRFAHHISHMASESFLAHELAYLVNTEAAELGLEGWHAELERARVDVTLRNPTSSANVYLELKQVPPDWWKPNWLEVYKDLGFSMIGPIASKKSRADYAVCFVIYQSAWPPNIRPATVKLYEKYVSSIPEKPDTFIPFESNPPLPLLQVMHGSEKFRAIWARPNGEVIRDVWVRVLWIKLA